MNFLIFLAVDASPFYIGARTSMLTDFGIDGSIIPSTLISIQAPVGQPIRMTVPSGNNQASFTHVVNAEIRDDYLCEYIL